MALVIPHLADGRIADLCQVFVRADRTSFHMFFTAKGLHLTNSLRVFLNIPVDVIQSRLGHDELRAGLENNQANDKKRQSRKAAK